MNFITDYLHTQSGTTQMAIGLGCLFIVAVIARIVASAVLLKVFTKARSKIQGTIAQVLLDNRVLTHLASIAPYIVVQLGVNLVPHLPGASLTILRNLAISLTVFYALRSISTALNVWVEHTQRVELLADPANKTQTLKGTVQLINIVLNVGAAIIIIATLIDRSPIIVLSGMGAMSAVLMLVFKDTILSVTAGVLISSNDMLRVGDWIEMPQAGANGGVIEIALHTVKIQNWDRTITTVPTWKFVSESYKNWRGMFESGGRRIMRSVRIDASTVRFLTAEELERLSQIHFLQDYLKEKTNEVQAANAERQKELGPLAQVPSNQVRISNLGVFRAYAVAYLRARPDIHKEMFLMVRQLESGADGIPVEVYCFSSNTAWMSFEGIQGDIFDHLFAILPELSLRLFQHPSGADMRHLLTQAAPSAPRESDTSPML